MFGIKEVHVLDYNEDDGADIIVNLNDDMPDDLIASFDVVLDGGTLEHVFDVAKAVKNIASLVKRGVVIHICPAARYVEHGFYSFSPTFFTDFYSSSVWEIKDLNWEIRMKNKLKTAWTAIYSQDCRIFQQYDNSLEWEKTQNKMNNFMDCILKLNEIENVQIWCIVKRIEDEHIVNEYPIQKAYAKCVSSKIYEAKTVNFESVLKIIKDNSEKVVASYGAGKICEEIIEHLYINDLENEVDYIFDSNIKRAGELFQGYKIVYPSVIKLKKADVIIICTNKYEDEIKNQLFREGLEKERIYTCTD